MLLVAVALILLQGQMNYPIKQQVDYTRWGFRDNSVLPTHQPYGDNGAICQVASGVPGLPLLVNVVPFISQM